MSKQQKIYSSYDDSVKEKSQWISNEERDETESNLNEEKNDGQGPLVHRSEQLQQEVDQRQVVALDVRLTVFLKFDL